MPVLSRTNLACGGVGDGQVSVEGAVPAALVGVVGGGTRWLDMGGFRPVYQRSQGGRYWLEALDLRSGVTIEVSGLGANRIEAGGGVWAAWLAGVGYRDALGRSHASWYPLAVDDLTGAVAVCLDYQAGAGLGILDQAGVLTRAYSGPLDRIDEGQASFRDGELAYRAGGALRVRHRDGTETVSRLPYTLGARHSRGYVVLWHEGHGLVLSRLGAEMGIPISADGRDFNPDLLTLESGLVAVVSSRTAGEAPGDLRRYLVNPITRTVTFGGQTVARELVNLAEVPRPALPVLEHPRAVWRGLCGGGPGNCVWGVVSGSDTRPILEGLPWALEAGDRLRWLFFAAKDFNPSAEYPTLAAYFQATVELARARSVPVVVYWDGATFEGRPWCSTFVDAGCRVIRGVQAYPHYELGERGRPDVTLDRINAVLTGHGPYEDWLIGPVYDYLGAWDVADVFAVNLGIDLLIQAHGQVVGDTRYGRGRVSCFDTWPDLQAYWAELCRRTAVPVEVSAPGPAPNVPSKPKPPAPHPAPSQEPAMPNVPDLDRLVNLAMPAWAEAFRASNGHEPSARDCAHILFRTLVEGAAPEVVPADPRPAVYAYEEFLDILEALQVVRSESTGGVAGVGLLAFWAFQLLVERKRYDEVLADARGIV